MTLSEQPLERMQTRADSVRARRARVERTIEPAPRRELKKRRRRRTPRRRYDLQLRSGQGAEVQLPALPTFRMGPRLLSAALLLVLSWGLGEFLSADRYLVESMEVSGNQLLSTAQIQSLVDFIGEGIFAIDPEVIVEQLQAHSEIETAQVHLALPNRVTVEVRERTAAVAWNDAGRTWWISLEGLAFIPQEENANLVRIETEEAVLSISEEALTPAMDPDVIRNALALSEALEDVDVLQYDPQYGFGFEDPRGWKVVFGVDGDMAMKVRVYRALIEKIAEKGISVALVNLEDQAAPYYRVER
jgi:predicted transcriptional regulator